MDSILHLSFLVLPPAPPFLLTVCICHVSGTHPRIWYGCRVTSTESTRCPGPTGLEAMLVAPCRLLWKLFIPSAPSLVIGLSISGSSPKDRAGCPQTGATSAALATHSPASALLGHACHCIRYCSSCVPRPSLPPVQD